MQYEEDRMEDYNEIIRYRLKHKEEVLCFGKHKGRHVEELLGGSEHFGQRDWWYVRYLGGMANEKYYYKHFPIPKAIKKKAQERLREYCLLCEDEKDHDWQTLCTECWRNNKNCCLRCEKYVKGSYSFCWNCNQKIKE